MEHHFVLTEVVFCLPMVKSKGINRKEKGNDLCNK